LNRGYRGRTETAEAEVFWIILSGDCNSALANDFAGDFDGVDINSLGNRIATIIRAVPAGVLLGGKTSGNIYCSYLVTVNIENVNLGWFDEYPIEFELRKVVDGIKVGGYGIWEPLAAVRTWYLYHARCNKHIVPA